jgi:hypothetical protein
MSKWEYATAGFYLTEVKPGHGEPKKYVYYCTIDGKDISENDYLDSMGLQGWEFCGVVVIDQYTSSIGHYNLAHRLYLKKPIYG